MPSYKTLYLTDRSAFHQQRALDAAPDALDITMLRNPSADELAPYLRDTVYLISERSGAITADMMRQMPKLKLILRLGSLTYDIDLQAAAAADVVVAYHPIESVIRVAEHAFMGMLALTKRLYEVGDVARTAGDGWGERRHTDENTFAYNWSRRTGVEQIYYRTVGLLGFGEIGAELARRLTGWGCTILYHKRTRLPATVERDLHINYVARDDLIAQSEVLVILLPYTPETAMSLGARAFKRMKDGAFVISVGSGGVIDEDALAAAIERGKLAGAALDTYDIEPIAPDNLLRQLALLGANMVLTPHTAAGTPSAALAAQSRRDDYRAIVRHLAGHPIPNRVV